MKKLSQLILISISLLSIGISIAFADQNTKTSKSIPKAIEIIDENRQEMLYIPIECEEHQGIAICCLVAYPDVCGQIAIDYPWGSGM